MKLDKNFFSENIKTLFYALIIAVIIRSLLVQPFYIPSSSMEPTLLVGDRLFVTKYSYGYSKHSFPFSPPLFKNRIIFSSPERGDVIVFKTPADNRTDYIKRLIGLPGDKVQFIDRIYSTNELKLSTFSKNKIGYFSKRFAAKEAFAKALGTGISNGVNFNEIIVMNEKNGKPFINIIGKTLKIIKKKFKKKIKIALSLSDEKKYAVAFVTISIWLIKKLIK